MTPHRLFPLSKDSETPLFLSDFTPVLERIACALDALPYSLADWVALHCEEIEFSHDKKNSLREVHIFLYEGKEGGGGMVKISVDPFRGEVSDDRDGSEGCWALAFRHTLASTGMGFMPFQKLWTQCPRSLMKDETPPPEEGSVDYFLDLLL